MSHGASARATVGGMPKPQGAGMAYAGCHAHTSRQYRGGRACRISIHHSIWTGAIPAPPEVQPSQATHLGPRPLL